MGRLNIVLDDELEEKFRRIVFERKGMKKGNISKALEEAIKQWLDYFPSEKRKRDKNAKG